MQNHFQEVFFGTSDRTIYFQQLFHEATVISLLETILYHRVSSKVVKLYLQSRWSNCLCVGLWIKSKWSLHCVLGQDILPSLYLLKNNPGIDRHPTLVV